MIKNWRDDWGQGDFPFYYVQIAPYKYNPAIPTAAELRWAQFLTLQTPNTGMAVITDIGNPEDIHPTNKVDVGKRLALWALAKDYGRDIVYSGPLYKSMKVEGNKIRIYFDCAGDGLVCKDDSLTYFTIAGEDEKFVPAKAVIDGQSVVVWSDEVAKPVAVRFGWENAAEPNLFNKNGLPASPFKTDDFEWQTKHN